LFALVCSRGAAFESDRIIAQFAHTTWGPKDGAPSVVTVLAQSTDGYLWLGSPEGLYRFDGVVFERYQPRSGGSFPAEAPSSLFSLPNNDLWIGFPSGRISLLRNGNATNYTTRDGVPGGEVWGFAQDGEGTIWAATRRGLARLEGDHWKKVGTDWKFPGKVANTVFLDRQGALWVATEDTLVLLPPGARRFQPTGIQVGQVTQIAQAPNGKLWMAETTRSVRPIPLSDERLPPDETEVQVGSAGILFDNDGALWITTVGDGLRRSPVPELLRGRNKKFSTEVESFTTKDGLSDDYVSSILQDREGNIWVGTNNGVDRFRKTNLVPVTLPIKPSYGVLAAGEAGDIWVYDMGVMVQIHEGRSDRSRPIPCDAGTAYRNPTGTIWWLCLDAIYRYEAGKYTKLAPPRLSRPFAGSVMEATEDGSGALWLSAEREGLFYRKGEEWHRLEAASELARLTPMTAFTDWMGRAWFGYADGTVIVLEHENIQRVFAAANSPVGGIRAINGRKRHTWIGGDQGLAFFDGNRLRRIVPADAESFGSTMGVEETPDGSLWLAESRGVIQIPTSEVGQALDNPSYRVKYRVFDSFDGLSGTFAGTGVNQKVIQGTDGRIWFAASGGIVWIDPANLSTNALPPPVLIRSVVANGRQSGSLANLNLPPRTTNLQIRYTGLSLAVPEKVRFRYLLEGVDKEWQDAGTRREAFYSNLGPGKYHFRVIASNNDGVWNATGASLNFSIAPAYYQTAWFRAFYGVIFLALLWVAYQLRVRQLQRQFDIGLEARVNERTRIARDLHDTLLQSFNALLLRLQTVSNVLPARPDEAKRRIDSAIEQASEAITEGRDAVHELRAGAVATMDLDQAISGFAKELRSGSTAESAPEIQIEVQGKLRLLNPEVRDEVFRIAAEALRNAIRHAHARRIEVEIRYDEHQLRLRIRDDGKGIDPAILGDGRSLGHWGLHGMQERAKLVGGTLEVWSQVDVGTEIVVKIPAANIYAKPTSARWPFSRFRHR
jgi:signal transduction histidine kinase/ligand-binding sensor domain-containing protein